MTEPASIEYAPYVGDEGRRKRRSEREMRVGKLVRVDTYKYIEEAVAEDRPTLAECYAGMAGGLSFGAVTFDHLREENPDLYTIIAPDTYYYTPLFALPERSGVRVGD